SIGGKGTSVQMVRVPGVTSSSSLASTSPASSPSPQAARTRASVAQTANTFLHEFIRIPSFGVAGPGPASRKGIRGPIGATTATIYSPRPMTPRIEDPAELATLFQRDRETHIYGLADLEEPYWSHSAWY